MYASSCIKHGEEGGSKEVLGHCMKHRGEVKKVWVILLSTEGKVGNIEEEVGKMWVIV